MKLYRYCRILSGWDLKDLKRQPRFGIIHCSATSDFSIALFCERHGGAALGWWVARVILNILIGSTAGRICLASEEILQFARLVWLQAKDCRSRVKEATLPWQWRVIFFVLFFSSCFRHFVDSWLLLLSFSGFCGFTVGDSKSKMLQMSSGRTRGSRGMTWTKRTKRQDASHEDEQQRITTGTRTRTPRTIMTMRMRRSRMAEYDSRDNSSANNRILHFHSFSIWGEMAAPSPELPSGATKSALKVPTTKCCHNQARIQLSGTKMLEEMCKSTILVSTSCKNNANCRFYLRTATNIMQTKDSRHKGSKYCA